MARNYDSIDLDWTWDGDFIIDGQGDLKDTSEDFLLSFTNEVRTIIKSSLTDWREDPSVGSNLDDFVGEPNSIDTAVAIQRRISASLGIIVSSSDLSIRVVPVGVNKVLIILTIQVQATPENKLVAGESIVINFLYDYFEEGIFVPLDDLNKFGGRNI
jgi:hypothetical protein